MKWFKQWACCNSGRSSRSTPLANDGAKVLAAIHRR